MIKNIVFDMGEVLLPFTPENAIKTFYQSKKDVDLIMNNVFRTSEWIKLDRGSIIIEDAKNIFLKRLPERLHEGTLYAVDFWYKEITPNYIMEDLIKSLKLNEYNLYILSNAGKNYYNFRNIIPGIEYFDGEFVSADWGLIKPDQKIFRQFYSHFSIIPSQCFFIDDSPANIESAERTGMIGHIYLNDFSALLKALDSVNIKYK